VTNMTAEQLNDTNFTEKIKSSTGLVIVDFFAPWCGPCKMFGPIFEEVSADYTDVLFVKVNTEEAPKTAATAGVMSIPTIVFIKNGEEVERKTGFIQKEDLKNKIDSLK